MARGKKKHHDATVTHIQDQQTRYVEHMHQKSAHTVQKSHTSEIVGVNTINMKLVFAPLEYPLTIMGDFPTMLKHQDSKIWSFTDLNVKTNTRIKLK